MLIKNANLSNMWKICLAICFIREVHFLFIENTFAFSFWYKCEIRNLQIHIYFDKFDQNWYFNHYRLGLNWKKQKRFKNYLERPPFYPNKRKNFWTTSTKGNINSKILSSIFITFPSDISRIDSRVVISNFLIKNLKKWKEKEEKESKSFVHSLLIIRLVVCA